MPTAWPGGVRGCFVALVLAALLPAATALELNRANRAELEQLNGIGVDLAARILTERAAHGPFTDWADLERRVKGLRARKLDQLGAQGLTVGGVARGPNSATDPLPSQSPPAPSTAVQESRP